MAARDPRQARFVSWRALRWVVRNRAWTGYHLVRYWRFLVFKARNPQIITEGFVFLGKHVEITVREGYGRVILGRWVHLGDENRLRCHEGTLRVGDKCVFGRDNTVNCYLDIEFGAATIISDWVYICDFDHVSKELDTPIKDQGIVKSPVRVGPGSWIGTKASVLRGSEVGRGSIVAAHAVVRGRVPDYSIVAGVPGRVVKTRRDLRDQAALSQGKGRVPTERVPHLLDPSAARSQPRRTRRTSRAERDGTRR